MNQDSSSNRSRISGNGRGSATHRDVTAPIAIHKVPTGSYCPGCNSTDVDTTVNRWGRFFVGLVLFGLCEWIAVMLSSQFDEPNKLRDVVDIMAICAGAAGVCLFINALLGGNKCRSCGNIWFQN
jgi:hypothetical protein